MHDNPLFSTAADFVNHTSRHIFLTGKAGTGKTTFLKYIRENTRKKCVVVAPTGVAAINAGGVTMHSLFQLPLGPFLPVTHKFSGEGVTDQYTLFKNIRVSEEKRELFRDLELLIIDEISMVRCDMLDATDAILRYFRKMPSTPFGGVQVLYIGDLFQLPPVMPDSQWSVLREYYASPFFFHSRAVEQAPPVYVELKKIYRQNQQSFIDILNRIRNAQATREDLDILNARSEAEPESTHRYITLTTHNHKADRINAGELRNLPGKTHEFKGVVEGDFPDKALPTDTVLQLKVGAQVMFIRNDKNQERRFYNGKLATVKRIDAEGILVTLAGSDEDLLLEQETWNNIRYSYNQQEESIKEEKLGSFTQFPIRLAWAITVHKSQGLTFQNAIIDAGDSFAPGQVYVALSRCTSLDGLIVRSRIHPSSISTDPLVLEFARRESSENELASILDREKKDFQYLQLTKTFDLQKLADKFESYVKYAEGKQLPALEKSLINARDMRRAVDDLQNIAMKFQQQAMALLVSEQIDKLEDRVNKAVRYFSNKIADQLLHPLEKHIASLKGTRKVKQYVRVVRQLRNAVARKITALQEISYGDAQVNTSASERAIADIVAKGRKEKVEKGSSLRETLLMLREGITLSSIAEKRGLALSTVEDHMAQLIKAGDIGIRECMADNKIENIISVITEIKAVSLKPVKQKLGDDCTYGEIRAVFNHLQYMEKTSA